VLFAVPWHEHIIIGTTDNPTTQQDPLEPQPLEYEIQFLLDSISQFLVRSPARKDILSVFAGLRPLAAPSDNKKPTREISRDHKLIVSNSGLVTITGGKWTTYRKMAEDAVNASVHAAALPYKRTTTQNIRLHGYVQVPSASRLSLYGSDEEKIHELIRQQPLLANKLVEGHPYMEAEVVWAIRNEMAQTVEDVLARRLRMLFLDARAAMRAAPKVAELMMKELHLTADWKQRQLDDFNKLACNYLLN
jgi:glycerol-3-phosphate dehydrogenase